MGRKRKFGFNLPSHIHAEHKGGKLYLTFQYRRGTVFAGPRIKINHPPDTPQFWRTYDKLIKEAKKPARAKIPPNSVQALCRAYYKSLEFRGLAKSTQRDYARYIDLLEDRLGKYNAEEITPQVLLAIRDTFGERRVTANHFIAVMRSLFAYAVPRGFCKANPTREIRALRVTSTGAEPWPDWAIEAVLEHGRWEVVNFVMLGLYTGQRTADLVRMSLSHINGEYIHVVQQKTRKPLEIPIHKNLKPFIDQHRERGILHFVPTANGAPLTAPQWRAMWQREVNSKPDIKAIRDAGLSSHGLRKAAVVRLREAGVSIEGIMSITGQSRQMVEHYAKGVDQRLMAHRAIRTWEAES